MKIQAGFGIVLAACTTGSSATPPTSSCATAAGAGFASQAFTAQTARFTAELDATPSTAGVVGLANGAATQFSQLAAVVRFTPSGTIDVRDGSTYRADVPLAYAAGTAYHFKLDVDLAAHRYSVSVRQPDETLLTLATGYGFQTEQAGVAQLDHVVTALDSTAGSIDACSVTVAAVPPAAGACTAGSSQTAIGPATGVLIVDLQATPSADHTTEVIGAANGTPASGDDLAAAVRFAPSGVIDARDGDTYRATTPLAYNAGATYQLRLVVDVSSHTFSAFVQPPTGSTVEVAHDFAFAPSQARIAQLTTLAVLGDASSAMQVCNAAATTPAQLTYLHDGRSSLAPLPNDEVIASDGTRTMHLDAHGSIVAQVAIGGEVAVDATGNVAIASAANGTLTVASYTPGFAARWQVAYPVVQDETVFSAGFDAAGELLIATKSQGHVAEVYALRSDGSMLARNQVGSVETGGTAVALMRDGFAYSYYLPSGGMGIEHRRSDGQADWSRSWPGDFTIFTMASDAAGDLAFAGQYYEDIDFAPGVVGFHAGGAIATNTYVTLLAPDTSTVFASNAATSYIRGVATNGAVVAVSGEHDTGPRIPHLTRFDRTGHSSGDLENTGLGDFGSADRTWLAASGRVYWSRTSEFPRYQEWPYYVALPAR